jgi:Tol biopolymer transport system component
MERGIRLGPYEVQEQLGAGGMGEVYLAQDTRLGRKVAIKVLPAEFASDPERLARFEQEARAAAALNHPNIAVVHDFGVEDGTHYMVQELLQGRSLRDELAAGPLGYRRALKIAIEVATALRAAHGAGIVHRDLKPENIFVTAEGHAKVLDFGLAKLAESAATPSSGLTQSPTSLGTAAGMVMGTAGYMAPEQARGEPVDARADLFALGCVLYEALGQRRAFDGESVIQVLNRVLHEEAPALETRTPIPAELQRIIGKCLKKDPEERYQGAADLVVDLRALPDAPPDATETGSVEPAATARSRLPVPVAFAAMIALLLAAVFLGSRLVEAPGTYEATAPANLELHLDYVDLLAGPPSQVLALAPDARSLAFTGMYEGFQGVHRLDLVSGQVEALPGTEGSGSPFFSPDGRWMGYHSVARAAVMKVSLAGGAPITLAPVAGLVSGAVWLRNGEIVFSLNSRGMRQVSSDGGEVREITTLGEGETLHAVSRPLPGERRVLFTVRRGSEVAIEALDLSTGERNDLGVSGASPFYVEGSDGKGFLVYRQGSMLVATPFDPAALELTGAPVELVGPVGETDLGVSVAAHTAVGGGVLAYSLPPSIGRQRLVWVSPEGEVEAELPVPEGIDFPNSPRIDAVGDTVVYSAGSPGGNAGFGLWDRSTGSSSRLGGAAGVSYPTLSPDGGLLAFAWGERLALRAADGSDEPRLLLPDDNLVATVVSWSPDGRSIYFYKVAGETLRDLWRYDLDAEEAVPVLATEDDERTPMASPYGRWLAYVTDAAGGWEIFVLDLTEQRPPRQISHGGAAEPSWSADGRRLYYRSDDGYFMAADFDPETGTAGEPRRLFEDHFFRNAFRNTMYAVSPEGRFLLAERVGREAASKLQYFVGFDQWLRERVTARQ